MRFRLCRKFFLNNTFSDLSLKRSDVLYFDVSSELNINSKEMFIDYCCHLSGKGAPFPDRWQQ